MTKKYRIKFNKHFLKDLQKIPQKAQKHIRDRVKSLTHNPRPEGCKKLQGSKKEPLYRIRCGDYRVVYTIRDDVLLILVVAVGHRRDIYR